MLAATLTSIVTMVIARSLCLDSSPVTIYYLTLHIIVSFMHTVHDNYNFSWPTSNTLCRKVPLLTLVTFLKNFVIPNRYPFMPFQYSLSPLQVHIEPAFLTSSISKKEETSVSTKAARFSSICCMHWQDLSSVACSILSSGNLCLTLRISFNCK